MHATRTGWSLLIRRKLYEIEHLTMSIKAPPVAMAATWPRTTCSSRISLFLHCKPVKVWKIAMIVMKLWQHCAVVSPSYYSVYYLGIIFNYTTTNNQLSVIMRLLSSLRVWAMAERKWNNKNHFSCPGTSVPYLVICTCATHGDSWLEQRQFQL